MLQMAADRSPEQQRFIEKLREVKDAIGEWHDWQELLFIAGEVLDDGAGGKLLQRIKENVAETFERALLLTNEMRNTYLRSGVRRKRKAEAGLTPLPQPVLVAVSAAA